MRINITYQTINDELLYNELVKFDGREAMEPYAIMSGKTINALIEKSDVIEIGDGAYEFHGYTILKNNKLDFGDVDIR